MLRNVDANRVTFPAVAVASVMRTKLADAGGWKTSAARPARIHTAAISINAKFAAGPARDINAARRGYRSCHHGSYGALAHPIIHPPITYERIGTRTMPNGSRRTCGAGLRVT